MDSSAEPSSSKKRLVIIMLIGAMLIGLTITFVFFRDDVLKLIYPDAGEIPTADLELPPLDYLEATGEIMPLIARYITVENPDDPTTIIITYDASSYEGDFLVIEEAVATGHVGEFTTVVASGSEPLVWTKDALKRIDWSGQPVILYHADRELSEEVNVYRIILSAPFK